QTWAKKLSETPKGNLKWLPATSTAGTFDRPAAAKPTFSTESANSSHSRASEKVGRNPDHQLRGNPS
ncbi:hypothetical protein N0542_31495, partial [Pseudomonas aeruginosa]|nr:hypothetical protein [Pseudomonas aeruginosa]